MEKIWFVILFVVAVQSGCGLKKMTTNAIGRVATDGIVAVEGEEDITLARSTVLPLIKTLEVLHHGNPRDLRSLVLLSQSYGEYAFGFLEEDILREWNNEKKFLEAKSQADLFYRRGRDYGMRALSTSGTRGNAFSLPVADFKKTVTKLGKKYVPALFWTAFNWAGFLNMHLDDPEAVADVPRIEAMVDRVIALDSGFYYGSARALKGVMAAIRPKMLGGSPEVSEREFREAMRIGPNYLMTKILYAQYYARQIQDAALFRRTLLGVEGADATLLPEQRLANELAKRRAKILLTMERKFF